MIYLRSLKEQIKQGRNNNQTIQEILCKLIVWQYSDICLALKTTINTPISIEQFLCAYMCIDIQTLQKYLNALDTYKDRTSKETLYECLNCKVEC